MSVANTTGRRSWTDARTAGRALRAEKAQLLRWRRLLRARLDLAVAAYAPPTALGEMSWDLVPEAQLALPLPSDLGAAIAIPVTTDQVALMQHLRALDRRLAEYGAELDAAIESSTERALAEESVAALPTQPCSSRIDDLVP